MTKHRSLPVITITYCRPCGYLKRAEAAAAAIERQLGRKVELVPGGGGIYEVQVGTAVVAKRAKGYFPDPDEIVAAIRAAGQARAVTAGP